MNTNLDTGNNFTGVAPMQTGPFGEEIGLGGSRTGTPAPQAPDVAEMLFNLNERLRQLETVGKPAGFGTPKIGLPEKFSGSISRFRDFVLSVENVFALQPFRYPTDEVKTRFVGTLLSHEALAWFRDVVERKPALLLNYQSFMEDFRAFFDDPNAKQHAAAAIGRLKQGKGSVLVYATKFRRLAHETGFNNDALVDIFRRGLSEEIKDRLSQTLDEPGDLEGFIALCIRIDQRIFDRKLEKSSSLTPRQFVPRVHYQQQRADPVPMDLDSAQMHGAKKLTAEERKRRMDGNLCLYCGERNHRLNTCPARLAKMKKANISVLQISAMDQSMSIFVPARMTLDDLDFEGRALVDSGATGNFISMDLVEKWCLPTEEIPTPIQVRLADGSEIILEETLTRLTLSVAGDTDTSVLELDLMVVPNLKFDLILGIPWLKEANPHVNWALGSIRFNSGSSPTVRNDEIGDFYLKERDSNFSVCNLTARDVIEKKEDQRPGQAQGELFDKERSSNPSDAPLTDRIALPDKYREFQPVCESKDALSLPPSRTFDLEINLKDDSLQPPFLKIYPLSVKEEEELKNWIDRNLKQGLIRPSRSPAGAPIFFVKKKSGGLRPCIDYRGLNSNTIRDAHPLPLIDDIFSKFSHAKIFTTIDLKGAYNLVRIKEGHEWKAAFRCKFGHFEPLVVQFGLTNAPSAFQRFVNSIFVDLLDRGVVIYLDDIMIYSADVEEHEKMVREVLRRLLENQLVIALEKCSFSTDKLLYLGHEISADGVRMERDKMASIEDFPVPRNVRNLRSFLGLINYYRKFIPDFSKVALALTQLTRKDVEFSWGELQEDAYRELKNIIRNDVMLRHANPAEQFILFTDASDFALGSVLTQLDMEGCSRPVEFYSRKFLPSEVNYSVYDKELLAIVESFEHWRHYLVHSRHTVLVKSDHNNLKYFRTARILKPRHARWAEKLSEFDFLIEHISGKENVVADLLSRSPAFGISVDEPREVKLLLDSQWKSGMELAPLETQEIHDWPEDIAKYLASEDNRWECTSHPLQVYKKYMKDFQVIGDKLYFNDEGIQRLYLPRDQRKAALRRFHDDLGHLGADSISKLVKRRYYWPLLEQDLRQYCRSCSLCQLARSRGSSPRPPLTPIPPVAQPGERWGLDFLSNLPASKLGRTCLLTAVDYATRWVEVQPLERMTSDNVIQFLYSRIVTRFGCPFEIITDRGLPFMAESVSQFLDFNKIKHLVTSPYHPMTNGMVERMHGMLNHGITTMIREKVDRWDEFLDQIVFGIRTRTHAVTGYSPFYLLYGVEPRFPGDMDPPNQVRAPLDELERLAEVEGITNRTLEELGVARGKGFLKSLEQAQEMEGDSGKDFYFKIGDMVKMKEKQKKKFGFSWKGPYFVVEYGFFPTYWLMKPDGQRLDNVVNQMLLAPWTARLEDNESYFGEDESQRREEEDNVGSEADFHYDTDLETSSGS